MRLGYLYSRYPVLSQTFCDAEMLELERRGHELVLASLYPPKTELRHDYLTRMRARPHYAPPSSKLDKAMRRAKRWGRWPARLVAEHDQKYGPAYKAALRARNALFFVELFEREKVRHFHVHFANRAAHTALFVKEISGIPFSLTAHGQDFMSDLGNIELLREICAAAEFIGAETDYSRDLLASECPASAGKMFRVYNGLELPRFTGKHGAPSPGPAKLLSVGRLVPFKGFATLIDACAQLRDRGLSFTCEIIGDGPLQASLAEQISAHQLEDFVHLAGARNDKDVLLALAQCDLFVLASERDERGASDVFPTVIAEAMASGRPVVSTHIAGIPELVAPAITGTLVAPGNAAALAEALAQFITDSARRQRFGQAGRRRVEENFTIEKTIEPLLERFLKTQ